VIEGHLRAIGMLDAVSDPARTAHIEATRAAYAAAQPAAGAADEFPPAATLCTQCHTKAVVSLDNCMTCLNCGDSKCS